MQLFFPTSVQMVDQLISLLLKLLLLVLTTKLIITRNIVQSSEPFGPEPFVLPFRIHRSCSPEDSRTFLQIHQINMEWSDCEKLRHEETDEETDYCKEQRIRLGVKFFSSWNLFFSSPPYGTYFGTFNRF